MNVFKRILRKLGLPVDEPAAGRHHINPSAASKDNSYPAGQRPTRYQPGRVSPGSPGNRNDRPGPEPFLAGAAIGGYDHPPRASSDSCPPSTQDSSPSSSPSYCEPSSSSSSSSDSNSGSSSSSYGSGSSSSSDSGSSSSW